MNSVIEEIGRSVWLHLYRSENLMMIAAYYDDSGTDAANTSLIVAGFASTVDQWGKFSEEWGEVLAAYDVLYFHAKEFDAGRHGFGFYKDWPPEKRNEFLNRLLGIIVRRTHKSFATALVKSAYEKQIAPDERLRRYFGSPYAFAAFNCIHQTCDWRNERHKDTPILFYFDEGNKNEGDRFRSREALKGSDRLIADLTPGDDRKLPPLQAADLLAFELCADIRRDVRNDARYTRYPLLKLDEEAHEWLTISDGTLTTVLGGLQQQGYFDSIRV